MMKLWKLSRTALALVLVFSLTLCLSANGLTVLAANNADTESRKDAILNELFGEGVTTEEAFKKLMAETETMNSYVNQSFCYVPDKDSFYVAIGDETAAITTRQVTTYVDMLANSLDISYKNLSQAQMTIQDAYSVIDKNQDLIKKADLISLGFSNYGATYFMCKYMAGQTEKVTDEDWEELVGEENMPLAKELLQMMFEQLEENDIANFGGYDLQGGLECYAYAFLSNAIHQAQVIEAVREVNADAVIMLVGTYNDLESVKLDVNGQEVAMGDLMKNLVNASNLLATRNADAYRRVVYVDAADVNTSLDVNASKYTTPKQYVFAIVGRQGLPTAEGHKYIMNQIKGSMVSTCPHAWWDDGVVTTEPSCDMEGEITFTCTWCGVTTTTGVDKVDHTWDDGAVTKEPSCKMEGEMTYTCIHCGETTTDSLDKIDHTWDDGAVTKAPTATEDGIMTYTCTCCGVTKTEVIEKTGESTVLKGDVNGDGRFNARDARALLQYLAGLSSAEPTLEVADFNGDGRINARDARAILQKLAGLT